MTVIFALFGSYVIVAMLYAITAQRHKQATWKLAWLPFSILVFLLSATRVGGSDWENYEYLYLYMSHADGWLDAILRNPFFEPGYVVLNYFFRSFSEERRLLVVFESGINAYAIWLLLTRVKGGSILVVWLFPLQFANILGVRQTLATSLFIIAIILVNGRKSLLIAATTSLIHISSLILAFARAAQNFKVTWKSGFLAAGTVFVSAVITRDFLADKLLNYQENAADLTGFSGGEILIGKGLTLLVIFSIDALSRSQRRQVSSYLVAEQRPTSLYLLYLLILCTAIVLPPLARLLTPIELLLAWSACESVAAVRNRTGRLVLTAVIALVSMLKMIKISSQLGDIYEVCFFCA